MPYELPLNSTIPDTVPAQLSEIMSPEVWHQISSDLRRSQTQGCCCGLTCCIVGSLLVFPIGLVIGLISWPLIMQGTLNNSARSLCAEINARHYGNRPVLQHSNNSIIFNTTLAHQAISPTHAAAPGPMRQVMLPNGQVAYVVDSVQTGPLPVKADAAYASSGQQPQVVYATAQYTTPAGTGFPTTTATQPQQPVYTPGTQYAHPAQPQHNGGSSEEPPPPYSNAV